MTIIRITEFKGYSKEVMIGFLNIHGKSFHEVLLPKLYTAHSCAGISLQDYFNALWAGQLLYRISHDIWWNHPDPFSHEDFSIIVITSRINTFAGLLHYLCAANNWEDSEEVCIQFHVDANNILNKLRKGEEIACYSYAQFISQHLAGNGDKHT